MVMVRSTGNWLHFLGKLDRLQSDDWIFPADNEQHDLHSWSNSVYRGVNTSSKGNIRQETHLTHFTLRMHPRAGKGIHCYMFGDFLFSIILTIRKKITINSQNLNYGLIFTRLRTYPKAISIILVWTIGGFNAFL